MTAITSQAPQTLAQTATASPADDIASGRRVLDHARAGLEAMAANLGGEFVAALNILAGITGRVIVTGVGKSGHVGRKIAATLASTGTPAFFVHAGEASHGDMGMIGKHDAVIAISNSGEAGELRDVIAYTRRFGIPLVAITSRPKSSLAQGADIVLTLPDVGEACPMGLAPTTSTTLTLSLGDALAVALLERRGFTADEYKVFHPGGHLGRKLFKVDDLMHTGDELPLVAPSSNMSDVVLVMTKKTFGAAGVTDKDGRLVGIVTDGDLRRHIGGDLFKMSAADIMTKSPKVIARNVLAAEAMRRMNEWKITSVFVTDNDKPVGILRMHDVLRAGAV